MDVIILAAGRGERLRPLTDTIPKPLLPIKGQPIIKSLEILSEVGFEKANIVIGYKGNMIQKYLSAQDDIKIKINFYQQKEFLGSGHALMQAKPGVSQDFVYLASDTVFQANEIMEIIKIYKKNSPQIIMALKKVPQEQLGRRSTVKVTKEKKIEKIIEKPKPNQELNLTSAAPLGIFSPLIWNYLDKLKPNKSGIYELATAIQEMIDDDFLVLGHYISYSQDITYPSDILKYNFPYLDEIINNSR